MKYGRFLLPMLALCLTAYSVQAALTRPKAEAVKLKPGCELSNGVSSIDELVRDFLAALEAKDKDAINRLLITKAEYLDFVLPGAGAPGDPPRHYTDQLNDYAWGTMYGKTIYFRANLIDQFGGHHYELKGYSFRKGTHDYAWYRAHQRIKIDLVAENGNDAELYTGSIIEVNGRFKFISLVND